MWKQADQIERMEITSTQFIILYHLPISSPLVFANGDWKVPEKDSGHAQNATRTSFDIDPRQLIHWKPRHTVHDLWLSCEIRRQTPSDFSPPPTAHPLTFFSPASGPQRHGTGSRVSTGARLNILNLVTNLNFDQDSALTTQELTVCPFIH